MEPSTGPNHPRALGTLTKQPHVASEYHCSSYPIAHSLDKQEGSTVARSAQRQPSEANPHQLAAVPRAIPSARSPSAIDFVSGEARGQAPVLLAFLDIQLRRPDRRSIEAVGREQILLDTVGVRTEVNY